MADILAFNLVRSFLRFFLQTSLTRARRPKPPATPLAR